MFILSDLGKLREFAEETETFLEIRLKAHNERSQNITTTPPKSKKAKNILAIQKMLIDGVRQKYESDFPEVLRYSLFVHLHAKWEHSLEMICKHLQKEKGLSLSQKELQGDVLSRSKLYLTKVAAVGFPKKPATTESLHALNSIRNLIVHANGLLSETYDKGKRKAVIDYFRKSKTGSVINDVKIYLNRGFSHNAISIYESFWLELFSLLK